MHILYVCAYIHRFVIGRLKVPGSQVQDAIGFDMSYCEDALAVDADLCRNWRVMGSSDCRYDADLKCHAARCMDVYVCIHT